MFFNSSLTILGEICESVDYKGPFYPALRCIWTPADDIGDGKEWILDNIVCVDRAKSGRKTLNIPIP